MGKVHMEMEDYAIREIEEEDLAQLLKWRNSPEIRNKMLTSHIITWEEHLQWYKSVKKKHPVLNFSFTYLGKLVGYIGYTQYDKKKGTCNPGNYLGPDVELPLDAFYYQSELIKKYAKEVLSVKQMITMVLTNNKKVLKASLLEGAIIKDQISMNENDSCREFAVVVSNL